MGLEVDFEKCYGWLIQFADGNRLDLHIEPLDKLDILDDKLCRILIAPEVGEKFGFQYNYTEAKNSRYYIEQMRNLPANAAQIF